jgi:hypothetical protein
MLLNLPDDASSEDALKALCLNALRDDPRVSKAARRVKIDRKTLNRLLKEEWGMVLAWVPAKLLEAQIAAESGTISPSTPTPKPIPQPSGQPQPFQSITAETARIRAEHERRRKR